MVIIPWSTQDNDNVITPSNRVVVNAFVEQTTLPASKAPTSQQRGWKFLPTLHNDTSLALILFPTDP